MIYTPATELLQTPSKRKPMKTKKGNPRMILPLLVSVSLQLCSRATEAFELCPQFLQRLFGFGQTEHGGGAEEAHV